MNTSDIVVLIILAIAVILAVIGTIRNKQSGGCGGNCAACGFSQNCPKMSPGDGVMGSKK